MRSEIVDKFIASDGSTILIRDDMMGLRFSILGAVASLVYMETLRTMQKGPARIKMATTRAIEEFLTSESFVSSIQNKLFDDVMSGLDYPVLEEMKYDNNVQLYISEVCIPELQKVIPLTIERKFEGNQLFQPSMEIDLFKRQGLEDWSYNYIVEETKLNLIRILKLYASIIDLNKKVEDEHKILENDDTLVFKFMSDDALIIRNINEITPIIVNRQIYQNEKAWELISFVTDTTGEFREGFATISTDLNNKLFMMIIYSEGNNYNEKEDNL